MWGEGKRERERGREKGVRSVLYPLAYGSSGLNFQILVPHLGDRGPSIWVTFCCLPRGISRNLDHKPNSYGSSWKSNMRLDCPQKLTSKRNKNLLKIQTQC